MLMCTACWSVRGDLAKMLADFDVRTQKFSDIMAKVHDVDAQVSHVFLGIMARMQNCKADVAGLSGMGEGL